MDTVRTATSAAPATPTPSARLPRVVSVNDLRNSLGRASAPLVIDVRRQQAFDGDTHMIAGATWRDPFEVADWAKYLPRHRAIVVYCVHGFEISKNAAAALAQEGLDAGSLDGGIDAWRAANAPTIQKLSAPLIPSRTNAPSVWVTHARPKIDRIACPWLIRRFIDPLAEFVYVPAGEVLAYAARTGANAYDIPGVTFTHRGDLCSFDALVADFDLHDPSLDALATIVRGADTGKPDLTPQSSGLLALSLGLSRLYPDDHEMLGHGMIAYDALYAWLQSARDEIHNADLFKKQKV
jgi:rhodanese-related sulfurtransferase